jgi:hypothetical protein
MKRTITLLAAFVIIIAGIAAIGVAVTVKRPERVVADALRRLGEERSFTVSITMSSIIRAKPTADGRSGTPEMALPLHVYGYGVVDLASQPKSSGAVLFTIADENTSEKLFGLEVRSTAAGTAYMRFTEGVAAGDADIAPLVGRWFYVDSAASGLVGNEGVAAGVGRVWRSFAGGDGLVYRSSAAGEILQGSPAGHFIIDVRRGTIDDALVELFAILHAGGDRAADDEMLRQAIARHHVGAEIWIDKKTGAVRRLGLAVVPAPGEEVSLPLAMVMDLSEFGKDVKVDAPQDVEPLSGALSSLFFGRQAEE